MCKICDIYQNKTKEEYDKILFESENFFVIPSLGSFIEDWFLICSKSHYISLANVPEKYIDEFGEVKKYVKSSFYSNSENVVFFEHGANKEGTTTGCSVDHCHIHAVPINSINLLELSMNKSPNFNWIKKSSYVSLINNIDKTRSYLMVENQGGELYYCQQQTFESQYFRKLIASVFGFESSYDWKCNPFLEKIENTIRRLENAE